jgi:hypothetical protein
MKSKRYHIVGSIQNTTNVQEKIDTFKTHIYVSAHFPGLVQTLLKKMAGLSKFYGHKPFLLENWSCKCFQHI